MVSFDGICYRSSLVDLVLEEVAPAHLLLPGTNLVDETLMKLGCDTTVLLNKGFERVSFFTVGDVEFEWGVMFDLGDHVCEDCFHFDLLVCHNSKVRQLLIVFFSLEVSFERESYFKASF
jgi:hypothetical protein